MNYEHQPHNNEVVMGEEIAPSEGKGSIWLWVVLIVGFFSFFLTGICVLVGAMFWWTFSSSEPVVGDEIAFQPKPFVVVGDEMVVQAPWDPSPAVVVNSIDQALECLKEDGGVSQRQPAYKYLSRKENFDSDRRVEVCRLLLKTPSGYNRIPRGALSALEQWAGPEAVPSLVEEFKRLRFISKPLVGMLCEHGEVDVVAPLLASSLAKGGNEGLEKLGPESGKYVVPYLNSLDNTERIYARRLLEKWEVDNSLVIRQCIDDLGSQTITKSRKGDLAINFLIRFSGSIDAELQNELAAKIEKLTGVGGYNKASLIGILGNYPGEGTEKFLTGFFQTHPKRHSGDAAVVESLKKIGSEAAIDALVFAYFANRGNSSYALQSIGSPLVAKKLMEQFDQVSLQKRNQAIWLVKKCNGGTQVLRDSSVGYLSSKDEGVVEMGMSILSDCELDADVQVEVAQAISEAIDSIPRTTENARLLAETCSAARKWGGKAIAVKLAGFLDSGNSEIFRRVLYALVDLREPATYPAIAKLLFDSKKKSKAYSYIPKLGIDAESAVLAQLENQSVSDYSTAKSFFRLVGRIGGNESLEYLRKLADETDASAIEREIRKAIAVIERKPAWARISTAQSADGPIEREWLDRSGKKRVIGKLLVVADGKAMIQINEEVLAMKLELLSQADRQYIEKEMKKRREAREQKNSDQ